MAAEFLHHVAYVNLDEFSSFNERVCAYDVIYEDLIEYEVHVLELEYNNVLKAGKYYS